MRRSLIVLGLVLVGLAAAAGAHAAIGIGVHSDVARFDRLTGQRTQSSHRRVRSVRFYNGRNGGPLDLAASRGASRPTSATSSRSLAR